MSIKGIEVTHITLSNLTSHKQQEHTKTQNITPQREIKINEEDKTPNATNKHRGETIAKIVQEINQVLEVLNREVRFSYNTTIRGFVVKVIDVKTGQVIREIPPKDVINLQKKLIEFVGMIFDSKEESK